MSKFFIFATNSATEPYPVYPLGMSVAAKCLKDAGHEVRQFDLLASANDLAALTAAVQEFDPDYLGLSLRNIDNTDSFSGEEGWYLAQTKHAATAARAGAPSAPLIVGGPALSILPEQILDYLHAEYGVVGEAEESLPQLVHMLDSNHPAPRIMRSDSLQLGPHIKGALVDSEISKFYLAQTRMLNIQSKRGCPYRCSYCTYPYLEGGRFRPRNTEDVVDEITHMHREYGVNHVFFTDSIFNDPQGHYLELAEALARKSLPVQWTAFFRPDKIERSELRVLKKSGLHAMELGTDAAGDETLAAMNKGFTFDDVQRFNENCLAEGIPVAHFIIMGGPDETAQTVARGLKNIKALGDAVVFVFSGIRVLPGAPFRKRAIAEGQVSQDDPLLKPVYYFSPLIDHERMNEQIADAFQGNRLRLFPPSEAQVRMQVMLRFGYRGLLWDELVRKR